MSDPAQSPRFQVSLRTLLLLMLAVGVVFALFFRANDRRDLPVGRYQVVVDKDGDPMMFDTATGQGWARVSGGDWYELPVPRGVLAGKNGSGSGP